MARAERSKSFSSNLNSLGAILGNDVAMEAYREKKLPFPDGTNIQFMIRDSAKYAATARNKGLVTTKNSIVFFRGSMTKVQSSNDCGWGFGHFNAGNGKPGDEVFMKTCFPCHAKAQTSDFVFTRYAP
jgi:hypothetical protein